MNSDDRENGGGRWWSMKTLRRRGLGGKNQPIDRMRGHEMVGVDVGSSTRTTRRRDDSENAVETEQGILGVEIWARDATRALDEERMGGRREGEKEERERERKREDRKKGRRELQCAG